MRYWQLCTNMCFAVDKNDMPYEYPVNLVYEYVEDHMNSNVLNYYSCLYKYKGLSTEEILMTAAIQGDAVVFKIDSNEPKSVILKSEIEELS